MVSHWCARWCRLKPQVSNVQYSVYYMFLQCIVSESFQKSSLLEMKDLPNYCTIISVKVHWKPTLITWPELEKKKDVINSPHGIIKSCGRGHHSAWGIAACPHISYRGDISLCYNNVESAAGSTPWNKKMMLLNSPNSVWWVMDPPAFALIHNQRHDNRLRASPSPSLHDKQNGDLWFSGNAAVSKAKMLQFEDITESHFKMI